MRSRACGLLASVVVWSALFACSAPEAPSRWTCQEDNCTTDTKANKRVDSRKTEIGLPEAALPEDQEQPPATTPTSGIPKDAGTMPPEQRDGGTTGAEDHDAGPPTPAPPVLNASNACWSGTLQAWVEVSGCYQRKSDGMWFQCGFDTSSQSNLWFRNVVNGVGRFGPCSSLHPLP
jgi:hypothetical protein